MPARESSEQMFRCGSAGQTKESGLQKSKRSAKTAEKFQNLLLQEARLRTTTAGCLK